MMRTAREDNRSFNSVSMVGSIASVCNLAENLNDKQGFAR